MGVRFRSALSREPLTYSVGAEVDGNPWYPSVSTTIRGAYLASPLVKPTEPDWVAGTFDLTSIGTVRGLVMVGPGSAKVLAVGEWYEWVEINDPATGAKPVQMVGSVIIQ